MLHIALPFNQFLIRKIPRLPYLVPQESFGDKKCTEIRTADVDENIHDIPSIMFFFSQAALWRCLGEQAILHVSCYTHRWEHTGLITGQWSRAQHWSTPPWLHKPIAKALSNQA